MVPLHSFKRKHIRIGRDALWSFWSATGWDGRRHGEIVSSEDFNEEADLFWRLSFNMEKFETNNRKFANTLTTDGTSLCVQVNVDCGTSLDKPQPHQLFSIANGKHQFHPMPQYNQRY